MALDSAKPTTVIFANASSLEKSNKMLDVLLESVGQPNETGNHPFLSEDGVLRLSGNSEEVKETLETLFAEPTLLTADNINQKPIVMAHVIKNAIKDERVTIDPKAREIFKDLVEEYSSQQQDENAFFKILIDRLIQNNLLEEAKMVHNWMTLSYMVVKQNQLDTQQKSVRKSQMATDAVSRVVLPNIIHKFIDSDPITEIQYQNRTQSMMMKAIDNAVAGNNTDFTKRFDIERPNEASVLEKKYNKLSQEPAKIQMPSASSDVKKANQNQLLLTKVVSFAKDLFKGAISWLRTTAKGAFNFISGILEKRKKIQITEKQNTQVTPLEHLDQAAPSNESVRPDISVQKNRAKGPEGRRLPTRRKEITPMKTANETGIDVPPPSTPPPPPPIQQDELNQAVNVELPAQAKVQEEIKQRGGIVSERKKEIEKAENLARSPSTPERRPPSMISAPEIQEGGVNVKKLRDMFEKKEQERAAKEKPTKPKSTK